jgi:hypothetical protein
MFNFKNLFQSKKEPELTPLQSIVNSYKQIKLKSSNKVFSSDNSILQIPVCSDNIIEYTLLVEKLYGKLIDDELIPLYILPKETKLVYLRDFYTDKDCYLDTIKTTEKFIEIVVKFLELYDLKERSYEKTFTLEKNLLVTSIVIRNLSIIVKDL